MILLIGSKLAPIFISLLVIVPIAYENIYAAFINVDKDLIDEAKLVSNINLKIIFSVFVPVSANYLISTLLSCFGLALKVLVMSEVLTQGNMTIGGSIQIAKATIDITRVFSWSIILVIIVLINIYHLMRLHGMLVMEVIVMEIYTLIVHIRKQTVLVVETTMVLVLNHVSIMEQIILIQ